MLRMGEGKRDRSQQDRQEREGESKNQRRRGNDRDAKVDDELVVYRILCPDNVIGSVIGKGGNVINSIRQDTKAKIKVMDRFPGAKDRVIAIYCYVRNKAEVDEEFNDLDPLCPAQDALFKIHAVIVNAVITHGNSDKRSEEGECRILVPSSQSAYIIGKSGSSINRLKSKTRADIKVIAKDVSNPAHACAMEFDNFIRITGDPEAVSKALFAVSAIMFKFTSKEAIPYVTNVPEALPTIIIPSDVPIYHASKLYPALGHNATSSGLLPVLGSTFIPNLPGYAGAGYSMPVYPSVLPVVSGCRGASRSEELTLRVLCPSDKIGRVIGKGGNTIKRVRQASGANIEVDDVKPGGSDERIIVVTSHESPDEFKCKSIEAVLLLQEKINDKGDEIVTIRLLVPAKIIGVIIGRNGSVVSDIRNRTKAGVRISKERKPSCASDGDELVEVVGSVASVRAALIQIILRLRDDVLKEKVSAHNSLSVPVPIYSGSASFVVPSMLPNIPPVTKSSNLFHYGSLPTRTDDNGSSASYSTKPYGGLPPPLTIEMLIPGHAVGKVLGKNGANLANIRKISGSVVEISEKSCGDCVAFISGTSEQIRSAEDLIQAFIMAT